MASLEDLGSAGHALSALSYGRETAACCAAEMAVHACERVSQTTQGDLVLFLMAAPANGQSAVVLYGGDHAQQCSSAEQNNIATGMRLIMGSLRNAAPLRVQDGARPSRRSADPPPVRARPLSSPSSSSSQELGRSSPSTPATPPGDLHLRPRAGGQPRPTASGATRRGARTQRPRRAPPAVVMPTRPLARFPDLLSFAPMVGPKFVDSSEAFVVTEENTVVVPDQLCFSLLGRLRERFSTDRALSKHFLQLIRLAANDFLSRLPSRSRTSTQASKYLPMTPVAVTKVAIEYNYEDVIQTVAAPSLTNTGDVDPVRFLGLICFMVHIKDAAYMWLVEEICSGAQVPPTCKAKRSAAASAAAAAAAAGAVAAAAVANDEATTGGAGEGGAAAQNVGEAAGGGAPVGSGAVAGGAAGAGDAPPPARASLADVNAASASMAAAGGNVPAASVAAASVRATATDAGATGRDLLAASPAAAGFGVSVAAAGNVAAARVNAANGSDAAAASPSGATVATAAGFGGGSAPSPAATAAAQLELQENHRRGGSLSSLPPHPQRWSLLLDGVVVGSGVLLPVRSHMGSMPVSKHLFVVCQVDVLEEHTEKAYDLAVAAGVLPVSSEGDVELAAGAHEVVEDGGPPEVPLTLGAAALRGCDLLWKAASVGYVWVPTLRRVGCVGGGISFVMLRQRLDGRLTRPFPRVCFALGCCVLQPASTAVGQANQLHAERAPPRDCDHLEVGGTLCARRVRCSRPDGCTRGRDIGSARGGRLLSGAVPFCCVALPVGFV